MADIDQVKPVPATIRPLPLASLNSLSSIQKSLGEDKQVSAAAMHLPSAAVPAGSASQVQVQQPAARPQPAPSAQALARQPLSARAPPALQGALEALPAADSGGMSSERSGVSGGSLMSAAAEVPAATGGNSPAESEMRAAGPAAPGGVGGASTGSDNAKGGVVGVLIHDIAEDLGF